jgi:hypothetical protein
MSFAENEGEYLTVALDDFFAFFNSHILHLSKLSNELPNIIPNGARRTRSKWSLR